MPPLHIPSLSVEGFRGLRFLKLENLGRATLLAGKNAVGKTTVLEAIMAFASRGETRALMDPIIARDEFVAGIDANGNAKLYPDFTSLFFGYGFHAEKKKPLTVRIGTGCKEHRLSLNLADDSEDDSFGSIIDFAQGETPKALRVSVGQHSSTLSVSDPSGPSRPQDMIVRNRHRSDGWPEPVAWESLGPGHLDTLRLTRLWDRLVLTDAEDFVVEALRLITGETLERLAVIGDLGERATTRRRIVAKLKSSPTPVPLKRLGDGAQRLVGIAMAFANCSNGILLIDEVENGVHYSIQPDLWRLIFGTARQSNTQVIAATHSWDCIASFAAAAKDFPEEGALIRLERDGDRLDAVHYSQADLAVAARQGIEVR